MLNYHYGYSKEAMAPLCITEEGSSQRKEEVGVVAAVLDWAP